jgi:hypothetical protein
MRTLSKIRGALLALALLYLPACNTAEMLPETAISTAPATATAETGWMSDAQKEAIGDTAGKVWVAAWFAGEQFMSESLTRRWRQVAVEQAATPQARLALSVDLLDRPPPPLTSAFERGLDVRGVSYEEGQVWIDLDAASPGLRGHGSAGLLVGSEQLKQAAIFYFPEARTLCVAYDGVPTTVEEGGPIFLHDASGCPIPLR